MKQLSQARWLGMRCAMRSVPCGTVADQECRLLDPQAVLDPSAVRQPMFVTDGLSRVTVVFLVSPDMTANGVTRATAQPSIEGDVRAIAPLTA